MAYIVPPHIDAALQQLIEAVEEVDKKHIDPLTTSWAELEGSAIKLLRGPFRMDQIDHQTIALGLAAILGARLNKEHGAFWFPNRDALEGASMGFPGALIMLSPFGAVVDALRQAKLIRLEELVKEIGRSLAEVKFSPEAAMGGASQRLGPEDYMRLFDPAFLQFTVVDTAKAKTAWETPPDKLAREVQDALARSTGMPADAKQQFEAQIVGALRRMEPGKPMIEQVDRGSRVVELITHLFAAGEATGFAPEEFWQQVALPMLFIGSPAQFPPLEKEELEALSQGAEPVAVYVDSVPYQTPAKEEGLLGVFPVEDLGVLHPAFERAAGLRLVSLKADALKPVLASFDPAKSRDGVARFAAYAAEKSGKPAPDAKAGSQMADAALTLLQDLKRVVETAEKSKGALGLRRVTEAEAASESALVAVRKALTAPRIILA